MLKCLHQPVLPQASQVVQLFTEALPQFEGLVLPLAPVKRRHAATEWGSVMVREAELLGRCGVKLGRS